VNLGEVFSPYRMFRSAPVPLRIMASPDLDQWIEARTVIRKAADATGWPTGVLR
jgi:hypothetical protein